MPFTVNKTAVEFIDDLQNKQNIKYSKVNRFLKRVLFVNQHINWRLAGTWRIINYVN